MMFASEIARAGVTNVKPEQKNTGTQKRHTIKHIQEQIKGGEKLSLGKK